MISNLGRIVKLAHTDGWVFPRIETTSFWLVLEGAQKAASKQNRGTKANQMEQRISGPVRQPWLV